MKGKEKEATDESNRGLTPKRVGCGMRKLSVATVKPFNLAAQKVGDLACKIILAPLILAN